MAATTQRYEILLAAPDPIPEAGTPWDPHTYSSDFYFRSTGHVAGDGGENGNQTPILDTHTRGGDLTAPGSGYAWADLVGFADQIEAEFDVEPLVFGVWLTTKQSEVLNLPAHSSGVVGVRTFVDVEVNFSDWIGTPPRLRVELSEAGGDPSVFGVGDWRDVPLGLSTQTFTIRNLTFSPLPQGEAYIYSAFANALAFDNLRSLVWPSPARGGVVEFGWVRLRVEVDLEGAASTPIRRTYPRHDSLAGGATRNYPPSRALQTSNRIGGGYL